MQSPVALIPQLAGHIIAAGGKRLRPMLTLATARLCGYRGDRHIALAAAVEFIHTATLLHDDVVDDSDLRRGLATANAVWGNKPSVLVGDFLFSRAFELMVEDGSLPVLEILSRASAVIAEGEVLQLVTSNDIATTEAAYLEVINAKTAQLFAAASRIGAVVGGRAEAEEQALEAYGRNLGIAFQLIDDVLDYSARRRSSARPSATISARARSRCRSCWRCAPPTSASANSGAAPSRTASSATAISSTRSSSCAATARSPRRWSAPANMAARRAARCRLPRRARAAGARRGDRFLPRARLLSPARSGARPVGCVLNQRRRIALRSRARRAISRAAPECSSAW